MKYCPKCNETYKDENLNFCLNDGTILNEMSGEDAPPTVMLDASRVTNENLGEQKTSWGEQNTNFTDFNPQNQQIYQQPFSAPAAAMGAGDLDKTLPTIALITGIVSLVFSCCYLGIITGPIAVIIGWMGMNNANKNPETYGGKQFALIGMVLGGISFGLAILFIFLGVLGQILN